nr:hypothetical protein [Crocosphaera sp.]
RSGYQMKADKPLTLTITEIDEYVEGKFKVTNALRERLPQLTANNPVVQTLEAQVSSVEDNHNESDAETEEEKGAIPF